MQIDFPTGTALGTLFVFAALLVRSLLKTDDRWEKIVDEKDNVIQQLTEERNEWRDKFLRLIEEGTIKSDPAFEEET